MKAKNCLTNLAKSASISLKSALIPLILAGCTTLSQEHRALIRDLRKLRLRIHEEHKTAGEFWKLGYLIEKPYNDLIYLSIADRSRRKISPYNKKEVRRAAEKADVNNNKAITKAEAWGFYHGRYR